MAFRRKAFPMILLTSLSHIESRPARMQERVEKNPPSFQTSSIGLLHGELNPLDIRLLFFHEIDEIRTRRDGKADAGKMRDASVSRRNKTHRE